MADVRFAGIEKSYPGPVLALSGIDLHVADRELLVLVGPSGCGKSTLLRLVAGLDDPDRGEISIGGRPVSGVPPKDRDIAMVFQNYALYPHLSVFENLAFGLRVRKAPKSEIDSRVTRTAEALGLTPLLARKPRALSGGERQRVALGRAIVRDPRVFLFDEPLSNLDAALRVSMRTEIHLLHERLRTTMIYVTHDQVEAMTMADRIAVLNRGKLEQVDTPLGLYHAPANRFVAGFLGSPAMNFLWGDVVPAGEALRFQSGTLSLDLPPARFPRATTPAGTHLLGVRPEDLLPGSSGAPGPDGEWSPAFPLGVKLVEPMGNESYVHLVAGTETLVARVSPERSPRTGETAPTRFRSARLHLFHGETGAALTREAGIPK